MLNKENIILTLQKIGINHNDTILIHSSLKSIGPIEGGPQELINILKEYLYDGLLIFPTHTWNVMNQDDMQFDIDNTDSCVGALTNIARKTPGFLRSPHPTHSVCAYGKNAKWYIEHDLNATTPVGPNNCFGVLKEINAKMLFIGAPLSKITFVHSIEEEFDVKDRFTDKIYHFTTKYNGKIIDYFMPKHYSKYNPHLSEHYEKLLPIMLDRNIAKQFYFGNANSYIIDTKKCHQLVSKILTNDIHIFDSFKPIELID